MTTLIRTAKHLLLSLCAFLIAFSAFLPEDADARRLGGGGSFGMKRQITPPSAPSAAPTAPRTAPGAAPAANPGGRSWLGPIAGIAAGLGLAALMSHLGLSEEFGSLLLIALVIFGVFFLMRRLGGARPQSNGTQPAYGMAGAGQPQQPARPIAFDAAPAASASAARIPTGFDTEAFVRNAKLQFIRLQAANDAGDLADLQAATTPEVFAELKMQMTERGNAPQRTDVVELHADVLEVVEEQGRYIVSVRFTGLLREEENAAPAPFDEAWHLVKPVQGNEGWRIAGIQQLA